MYGPRDGPYGDPYARRPPMDPYGRGGYGGYGLGGLFDECGDMGGYFLPGLVVLSLFIALVLFITGFSAPYWMEGTDENYGLWRHCEGSGDAENCSNLVEENSPDLQWFTATQAMTTISLIFLILSFALLVYWLCSYSRYFFIKALIISLLFMTFIFMIVSVGVFGGNYDDDFPTFDLDWCFYLVCVAAVMVLIGAVFLFCVPSRDSYPDFSFRDRFGFGYGRGRGYGGGGPGPNPAYGAYGGGPRDIHGGGLPYTARY